MPHAQPLRIGFIGAGGIARSRHLPNLARIPGVTVQAVSNRSEASSRRVADDFGIPEIETDWRRLVERSDLDAVFIGTWPYTHREMSVAALDAGKHVFCQARMATDLPEARAMLAAAEAHPELVNMICPPPHRMPWEPYIQRRLAAGDLGELREVRLVCVNGASLGDLTWREQVEYSGQQVMQVGIWAETLHAWVGEYDSLTATTATPIATKPGPDGQPYTLRIPQTVLIQGTLRNGALISEHHSGVSPHESLNTLSLYGSKATLRVDAMQSIHFAEVGQPLEPVDVPADEQRDWRAEQDFVDAVRAARRGAPPAERSVSPDFREGLAYMVKIAAIHRAAETGQAVRLADL